MEATSPSLAQIIDELYDAASNRHLARVRSLLHDAGGSQLPHDVREEALALASAPLDTLRAPIALLRYRYVLEQLGDAGDVMPTSQLELGLEKHEE